MAVLPMHSVVSPILINRDPEEETLTWEAKSSDVNLLPIGTGFALHVT